MAKAKKRKPRRKQDVQYFPASAQISWMQGCCVGNNSALSRATTGAGPAGERIVKGEPPPVGSVGQRLAFHYGRFKEDNASGFESNTLGTERPNYFLENRLWNAFMAGAAARDKIMEQDKPAKCNRKKVRGK